MSMIKKKIIAFFVIIALFIIPVSVFADTPIPALPYDAYEYWAVVQSDNQYENQIILVTAQNPITYSTNVNSLVLHKYRIYKLSGSQWVFRFESGSGYANVVNMYASNHNIAYEDGSGFFFTPPKVSELYRIARQTDFGMILKNILAGLIPLVGLLILGISLHKGWGFLKNQLMH